MDVTAYTIGHGNQELPHLFDNLERWRIGVLIDVRSYPYSRRHPQFNQGSLEGESFRRGLSYRWLVALGGRPKDASLVRADGKPDYEAMSRTDDFGFDIQTVVDLARRERTAILCSESRPEQCHRSLLVAPALVAAGCSVLHILPDGSSLDDVPVPIRLPI